MFSSVQFQEKYSVALCCVLEKCMDQIVIASQSVFMNDLEPVAVTNGEDDVRPRQSSTTLPGLVDEQCLHRLKLHEDIQFLHDILSRLVEELCECNRFSTLLDSVNTEKQRKQKQHWAVHREEEMRGRLKLLQSSINSVQEEREASVQGRDELIGQLKLELQEDKIRAGTEESYACAEADNYQRQTQDRCIMGENETALEVARKQAAVTREVRVNSEVDSFLRAQIVDLERRVAEWSERCAADTGRLEAHISEVKAARQRDRWKSWGLREELEVFELAIREDGEEKERVREERERRERRRGAAILLQAWWRGVMVRRGLGPYKKKTRKGKKGKGKPDLNRQVSTKVEKKKVKKQK